MHQYYDNPYDYPAGGYFWLPDEPADTVFTLPWFTLDGFTFCSSSFNLDWTFYGQSWRSSQELPDEDNQKRKGTWVCHGHTVNLEDSFPVTVGNRKLTAGFEPFPVS
eukprot:gene359-713_t